MKKVLLLIISLLMILSNVNADIIVKKDGATLHVYNMEIGTRFITFTKEANVESELGRIALEECFAIKTDDGDMKTLEGVLPKVDNSKDVVASSQSQILEATPSSRNIELINFYNSKYYSYPENKRQDANKINYGKSLIFWGFTKNSILNDKNMIMQFEPKDIFAGSYYLSFINTANETLYINLAQSFSIDKSGLATPMYNGNTYTSIHGKGSSAGANLGAVTGAIGLGGAIGTIASGINVGGGSSNSSQVTTIEQSIMVVPPGGKVILPINRNENGDVIPDKFDTQLLGDNVLINKNGLTKYSDEDSPEYRKYIVSYSTDPDFNTSYNVPLILHIRALYGFNPLNSTTGLNGLNRDFFDFIRQNAEILWGVGIIEKIGAKDKKALKEALKARNS